jgi:hypothetical protein
VNAAVELGNEVVRAFGHLPELIQSPMFLADVVTVGIQMAQAPDDEARRGVMQVEMLKLEREWSK